MIESYDFHYTGTMDSSLQSIPIGNGDLGANVWVESNALFLLLSKTDNWSELGRLLKTGLLKVTLDPNPFHSPVSFHLSLNQGCLYVSTNDISMQIWVDANHPVYRLEMEGNSEFTCTVEIINYRDKEIRLNSHDTSNYLMKTEDDYVPEALELNYESADQIRALDNQTLCQYHHNSHSCYSFTLMHQGLGSYPEKQDPFLHHTFGFLIFSDKFIKHQKNLLVSSKQKAMQLAIVSISGQYDSPECWIKEIEETAQRYKYLSESDFSQHCQYWNRIWKKSYIYLDGDDKAKLITKGYIYQRYLNYCAGRGEAIKFNGSIFTVEPSPFIKSPVNYDYRDWGGLYWFQNTRLIYWSMLFSGDFELMQPLFRLYLRNMKLAHYRCLEYFGHEGLHYPETMTLFATYSNSDYGWDRKNCHKSLVKNNYIRWHYEGMLELSYMMLKYIEFTEDRIFYEKEAVPFIKGVLQFFFYHFEILDGKFIIAPSSALETWQNCVNDTPTVAGLQAVCQMAIKLETQDEEFIKLCYNIQNACPDISYADYNGQKVIAPFQINIDSKSRNIENPELYAVFPFPLFHLGGENLDIAIHTYHNRAFTASNGWQQHAIQAACLGLSEELFSELLSKYSNMNERCIFPCYWGPNYDWMPDQCNGTSANIGLTMGLVQIDETNIRIFPAWNPKYDVSFRLPVENNNFVTVKYKDGMVQELNFDHPVHKQVVIMLP